MKLDLPRIRKFSKNFRKGMKKFKGIKRTLAKKTQRKRFNFNENIVRHIPNIATVLALCSGLTSIRFAYSDHVQLALLAMIVAAIFDLLDGRIARMLGASSEFGAELDSLSDFVCFGAAPALIVYFFTLKSLGSFGWAFCLFFAVCSAFRLARFNIMTRIKTPVIKGAPPHARDDYFLGVPAPMGALMLVLPYIWALALGTTPHAVPSAIMLIAMTLSGLGMIAKIPTFSSKSLKFSRDKVLSILITSGIVLAALFAVPWVVLGIAGTLYLASIPMTYRHYTSQLARKRHRT